VALSINRATCCFDTSHSRYLARRAWGSVVYLGDNKHKRQPLGNDNHNGPRGFVDWRNIVISLTIGVLSVVG